MPPDTPPPAALGSHGDKKRDHSHTHKERIGNYVVQNEIGRGSFATVYKGYRSVSSHVLRLDYAEQALPPPPLDDACISSLVLCSAPPLSSTPATPPSTLQKTRDPVAIKAVSRQKLTTKLLENLESEINILKAISHRNIVCLQDCFKNDTHIYLVMEYCTGSDLSIYIKNRGKLSTLDFVPRGDLRMSGVPSEDGKVFWPHPPAGGLDERVTRSFLGQLAMALQFLRSQDLIHRDIKPQNLLLQPPSAIELAEGHPLGIPILKVADFGFARILPAAAMAETLCGSPLYMAPEILRYEKYDAKADLWSVGAVLFEMAVGRPPFRAQNHVELLKKIERGEDRIKFPDESSRVPQPPNPPPIPVSADLKALIRHLLKRRPQDRMGFEDFFACGAWDGFMTEGISSSEGSMALDASSSTDTEALAAQIRRDSRDRKPSDARIRAPQPTSVDPALNPSPAPRPPDDNRPPFSIMPVSPTPRTPAALPPVRSEPKYYVGGDQPELSRASGSRSPTPSPIPLSGAAVPVARPVSSIDRRRPSAQRDGGSFDDPPPLTPVSGPGMMHRPSRVGEGSPLAATPPMTMPVEDAGKDGSALENSDSVVNREYVVVEKQNVEINALADELDQASRANQALVRRPSSRTSVTTRPVSAFKPTPGAAAVTALEKPEGASYSPPFGLSTTPPFAQPGRTPSATISRPPSVPQVQTVFPPPSIPGFSPEGVRYGTSPSSLQTGAFARAITNTAIRLIGTGANSAATAIARVSSKRRPMVPRASSAEIDPAEEELIRSVEDIARKAFVLFELGDSRLHIWHSLVRPPGLGIGSAGTPPFGSGQSPRRKSSSSSFNSEVMALRQQQEAAGEATVLYCKALAFILQGTNACQKYWEARGGGHDASPELNELVQWLRARFNECYEKAEWAKSRAAEELPFVDRLVHDKARDSSRQAALAELSQDYATAEAGYETSVWLLQALLDDVMHDGGHIREDDRISIEKVMTPIKVRLTALRKKMYPEARIEQS